MPHGHDSSAAATAARQGRRGRRAGIVAATMCACFVSAALAMVVGGSGSAPRLAVMPALAALAPLPPPDGGRVPGAAGDAARTGSRALHVPPLLAPTVSAAGVKTFRLTARSGGRTINGVRRITAGFNGTYLAPTIRVARGDRVKIHVKNAMGQSTTVHWHGLHVPAASDGGPHQPIAAGATWSPTFTVRQRATTLWYHPHLMGRTEQQVARGMVGMLEIADRSRGERALPHQYGVDDFPIVLQPAPPAAGERPRAGGVPLANGTPGALLVAPRSRTRLRLVNAAGTDLLGVTIRGARRVWLVASDGGLLRAPLAQGRVLLGPSERAQFVVDTRPGADVTVRTTRLDDRGSEGEDDQHSFIRGAADPDRERTVLVLRSTAAARGGTLPARLVTLPRLDLDGAARRSMQLGPRFEINGDVMTSMDDMSGLVTIPVNSTEVWTISNSSNLTHLFHVHDVQFEVLDRDGLVPPAYERGTKDTVRLAPGEVVRIAMRFSGYTDADNPYMLHCHILSHEDAGMMQPFVVVTAAEAAAARTVSRSATSAHEVTLPHDHM